MSKNFKFFLIIFFTILSIIFIYTFSQRSKLKQMCLNSGGKYLFIYNECQETNSSLDDKLSSLCDFTKGEFNSCASPCRHSPGGVCITMCEQVCKF